MLRLGPVVLVGKNDAGLGLKTLGDKGLNLIEALQSGKRFRRFMTDDWIEADTKRPWSTGDVLAHWEVEEKPKVVTWYRPKLFWFKKGEFYSSERNWFRSVDEAHKFFFDTYNDYAVVIEWEERELPEVWDGE